MAKGKKTGGRNFKKGHHRGRPKGAKDKVPRSFKASVRRVYEELGSSDPTLLMDAVRRGLKAAPPKSYQYLQLGAYYLDGKPVETVKLRPDLSGLTETELTMLERLLEKANARPHAD